MIQVFIKRPDLAEVICSLRPNCSFKLVGFSYDGIEWDKNNEDSIPTREEVQAEFVRLNQIAEQNAYLQYRKAEYPPIQDLLDGIVKNDQNQIDQYKADYLAVNAKYPAPGVE